MNEIICGDALATLKTLESGIVQTCITSPPYFGLRDYQVDGQIGLELEPETYINRLVEVFREVRRVLRDDGTLWVNIADSYAGSGKGGQSEEKRSEHWQPTYASKGLTPRGYKPKDLYGIPWMLAFALRAEGYYLRQDIIWSKPNCMPESVTDRPTKAHEYIFLLSKSANYYYDAQAIAEPSTYAGDIVSLGAKSFSKGQAAGARVNPSGNGLKDSYTVSSSRNKRSVWTVATSPYSEAHFATFPPKLIEPCILAGTSHQACEHCGAPWERVTETTSELEQGRKNLGLGPKTLNDVVGVDARVTTLHHTKSSITTGWQPTCTCTNEGSGSCVVLDPFMGAGTVAMTALKYQRAYIGIELNPEYVELANKRIHTVQPVLWEVSA